MLWRFIYNLCFYLALPLIFIRLLWRSRNAPLYRQRLKERLGFYPMQLESSIWVHAVSLGEVIAATPLIKLLLSHYPEYPLVVTTMTPTGALKVKSTFQDKVRHLYLPYDVKSSVNRFLKAIQPKIGVIIETELWPNLIAACREKNIPICLTNARLSEKSFQGYRLIPHLTQEMLNGLKIAAHGEKDAARFLALGAPQNNIIVTGSLKFDLSFSPNLWQEAKTFRQHFLSEERFIWIAASTHEGEEEQLLAAHHILKNLHKDVLFILVPRHPERFDAVYKLCSKEFKVIRRSEQKKITEETSIFLADSMGEMLLLMAASDVAFVGGSLIKRGGHNTLEPAALGKPVLTGPHVFNFTEINALLTENNALITVENSDDLAKFLIMLYEDREKRKNYGASALSVVEKNRGALNKQFEFIQSLMS